MNDASPQTSPARTHFSVMLPETIEFLRVETGRTYFDGTFGEGGHTEALLERGAKVYATDRDAGAIAAYRRDGKFRADPRLVLEHARFSSLAERWPGVTFDGAIVDLGVSTQQILSVERGFSFRGAGPLDMRMDASEPTDLATWLETSTVEDLAVALEQTADLPNALPVARALKRAWADGKLTNTEELQRLYRPRKGGKPGGSHVATPLFLALRRLVNEEREETADGLPVILDRLSPGGRLAVLTFHSTEDREVKKLFQRLAGRCACEQPICTCPRVERARILTPKPIDPSREELRINPRSRSAKLRCVEKIG